MPTIAFLTLDQVGHYVMDDDLAVGPLEAHGWSVSFVPWRRPDVDWRAYDAVVIRSPWDYQDDVEEFLNVLARIERCGTPVLNPRSLVAWNVRKTYLRDLAARGVPIVPTIWRDRLTPGSLRAVYDAVGTPDIVVKPVVSASAIGAYRLDAAGVGTRAAEVEAYFADRALMAQPFLTAVLDEGEFSAVAFDGVVSHTLLKTPKAGDFRSQEEYDSFVRRIDPEPALSAAVATALEALGDPPLYARVDLVRAPGGTAFWLMELEVIEPSLYLRLDAGAPDRFARAIADRLGRA